MPAISREPSRNFSVSSSPANLMVITVPRAALVAVVGGSPTRGLAQQVGQLADAGLLLALLVLGRVVAAVLLEVALFAAGVDLRGHRRAAGHQLVELGLQPVVGFLGQPDALGCSSVGVDTGGTPETRVAAPVRGRPLVDPAKLTPASAAVHGSRRRRVRRCGTVPDRLVSERHISPDRVHEPARSARRGPGVRRPARGRGTMAG